MTVRYDFPYATHSTGTVTPSALEGSAYWYDSGTTEGGFAVYYDTSDTYAYFYGPLSVWLITAIADVGTTPTDRFEDTGSVLVGQGAFSGTLTPTDTTIADAWYRAETTAFESFRDFVGATEGREAFRGFLPVEGDSDDYKLVNVWSFTSGDSGEFDMDRIKGDNPNWCSLRSDARIESLWTDREKAMQFSGAVISWLQHTSNLNAVGNVTWCTLAEVPSEPEIYRTDGRNRQRYWIQTINLELVYKTGTEY